MNDIVERLRLWPRITLLGGASEAAAICNGQVADMIAAGQEAAAHIEAQAAEIARLRTIVRVNALRQGATDAEIAAVLDPIGCPMPGACAQVAEIARLRGELHRVRGMFVGAMAERDAARAALASEAPRDA